MLHLPTTRDARVLPKSPTITITWNTRKYCGNKIHQAHIPNICTHFRHTQYHMCAACNRTNLYSRSNTALWHWNLWLQTVHGSKTHLSPFWEAMVIADAVAKDSMSPLPMELLAERICQPWYRAICCTTDVWCRAICNTQMCSAQSHHQQIPVSPPEAPVTGEHQPHKS